MSGLRERRTAAGKPILFPGVGTIANTDAGETPVGRVPDAGDPVERERLRRLYMKRRMANGGRLSTILSDELRSRVT